MIIVQTQTTLIVKRTMSAPVKKTPGAALYTRAASPGCHFIITNWGEGGGGWGLR